MPASCRIVFCKAVALCFPIQRQRSLASVFLSELYTVTVLTEAAMMGADIDGDVLVYLDMAQVVSAASHHLTCLAL